MRHGVIWLWAIVLALMAYGAQAADCGGEVLCEMEDGFYHAKVPATTGPHPAVIFLHGYGGRGAGIIENRGLVSALNDRGYAVIAPQGIPRRPGDKGGTWNSRVRDGLRDDVAWLAAVAEDAATRLDIDRERIVLAGFSAGGMMAWRVACDAPNSFDAYAPIAGLMWRPLPEQCVGPVRMLHTHGWSDPVVPLEGRTVNGSGLTQGDLFRGLRLLRAASGCSKDAPNSFARNGIYQHRRWSDCVPGSALEFALHPGGHSIPKGWSTLALDWFEALDP